jgi:hypothetical protein
MEESPDGKSNVPFWQPVILAGMAGGMGWGIRGQYGHETGAMIAGLLIGLVLTLLFRPRGAPLSVARAVAWCTIAMGFGGLMTYGQTIGLTHDAPLIGNWAALRWGMLGLSIKGGIWIGFAGTFLGMGLGGKRYRPAELALVILGLLGLAAAGIWALNSPFDPDNKILPRIYFSDDWRWEPGADLKPRPEVWGGLLFALGGLLSYTSVVRRDPLALRLGLFGILGGAMGFPLGQSLQAFHAWNPELFRAGIWVKLEPCMNWWNHMETTFGATMGAVLGFGLWWNHRRIAPLDGDPEPTFPAPLELVLAAVHVALLVTAEFFSVPSINAFYDFGLILGFLPVVAVAGGRWWPYLLMLPITALPIAGKTVRQLVYREAIIEPAPGWILYLVVPLTVTTAAAVLFARTARRSGEAAAFQRPALLLATWLYFGLNQAFFRFPWPWATWTLRTPNAIVFTACALGLTWAALCSGRRQDDPLG